MPITPSLSASKAALAAALTPVVLALTTAPAAATEFPKDFPYKIADRQSGENTPLNLSDAKAAGTTHASTGGGGLVRTIVGLAIVIGVIYGLTWVLKQVKSSKEAKAAGTGLAPLATVSLGPNRSLHLVRAGREIVLVGASENSVTPIRVYREDEARELGLLEEDEHEVQEAITRTAAVAELPASQQQLGAGKPDLRQIVRRVQDWTVRS